MDFFLEGIPYPLLPLAIGTNCIFLEVSQNCRDQGKFKSTTLLHYMETCHNDRLQEMPQIVWIQKYKSEHVTIRF